MVPIYDPSERLEALLRALERDVIPDRDDDELLSDAEVSDAVLHALPSHELVAFLDALPTVSVTAENSERLKAGVQAAWVALATEPVSNAQSAPGGAIMRYLRRRAELTIDAVAAALEVSHAKVGLLEEGKSRWTNLGIPRMQAFARAVAMPFDDLIQALHLAAKKELAYCEGTSREYQEWKPALARTSASSGASPPTALTPSDVVDLRRKAYSEFFARAGVSLR